MKRWLIGALVCGITWTTFLGFAQAQYRPPAAKKTTSQQESSAEVVDPARFRKGNFEWDTQEMIAAGFNALHRENVQILKELRELKAQANPLKGETER